MKLLQEKLEEDRRRLEEQFRSDMEAQRELMEDMRTANMDERQAFFDKNQTLVNTIGSMKEAMDRKDDQIEELVAQNANRPPSPSPPCHFL